MQTPTTFKGLVGFIIDFINILIPTLFGLLFVYIVWKIIDAWVLHAGNEEKREEVNEAGEAAHGGLRTPAP